MVFVQHWKLTARKIPLMKCVTDDVRIKHDAFTRAEEKGNDIQVKGERCPLSLLTKISLINTHHHYPAAFNWERNRSMSQVYRKLSEQCAMWYTAAPFTIISLCLAVECRFRFTISCGNECLLSLINLTHFMMPRWVDNDEVNDIVLIICFTFPFLNSFS